MHIVVAGNIGSGKTTLTTLLAKHYGWKPKFEAVSYNPYLEDYYADIQRWAFNLEVYFLKERFKDCKLMSSTKARAQLYRTAASMRVYTSSWPITNEWGN